MTDKYAKLREAAEIDGAQLLKEIVAGLEGVTGGRWCQFHPSYCQEAKGWQPQHWDTSHDISAIVESERRRIATFKHASDAAYVDRLAPDNIRAIHAAFRALEADLAAEKARADAAEAEGVRLWNECRDLKGSLDAADAACSSIKRERDAAIHGGKDNPMVGTHPYYAAGISTAEIIAEAREFLEEELAQYMFPEYDADCEIDCQRSHGYIGALIERLSIAEATISTLTAERDALIRKRDEARRALILIATTCTEDSHGNVKDYHGGYYRDIARSALSDANAAEREG